MSLRLSRDATRLDGPSGRTLVDPETDWPRGDTRSRGSAAGRRRRRADTQGHSNAPCRTAAAQRAARRHRSPALSTHSRLPHRVRTLRAEAAPHPQEPAQGERTGYQEPEERGVEECVDSEAGPNGA